MEEKKGFTGSTLKIMAIISMAIDHFAASVINAFFMQGAGDALKNGDEEAYNMFLGEHLALYETYRIMRSIGRLAFPIFCFLLVEGFMHTRSKVKYAFNLLIFALISEIPFNLALMDGNWKDLTYQNVYFTLLIGLLVLCGIKFFSEKEYNVNLFFFPQFMGAVAAGFIGYLLIGESLPGIIFEVFLPDYMIGFSLIFAVITAVVYLIVTSKYDKNKQAAIAFSTSVILAGMGLTILLSTDYDMHGIVAIVIIYLLRENYFKGYMWSVASLALYNPSEAYAFIVAPFVKRYNGKRGISLKYFFYAFYPAHLLIYYVICRFTGLM